MTRPSIWVGLGETGRGVIAAIESRRPALLAGVGHRSDHVSVTRYLVSPSEEGGNPTQAPDGLLDAFAVDVPTKLRKGNMRGPCLYFVVASLADLARWPDLADPEHWIWSLSRGLEFSSSQIILIAVADGLREGGPGTGTGAASEALSRLEATVEVAAQRAGGYSRVITVQGTDHIGAQTPTPTSQVAIVLLWEMLNGISGDAYSPLVEDLLGIGMIIAPNPEEERPQRLGGRMSFGITATRYGIKGAESQTTIALIDAARRPGRRSGTPPEWQPQLGGIPLPLVPVEVPSLTWRARIRFLQAASEARSQIDAEEARLAVALPEWWESQVAHARTDASATRAAAAKILVAEADDFESALDRLWEGGAREPEVSGFLERAENSLDRAAPPIVLSRNTPQPPSFTQAVHTLRVALLERPSPLTALGVALWASLVGAIVSYGAVSWLAGPPSSLAALSEPPLSWGFAIFGAILVCLIPLYAWVMQPWRRIRRAELRIERAADAAKLDIQRYRRELAAYVKQTVEAELIEQLRAHVRRAHAARREYFAAFDQAAPGDAAGGADDAMILESIVAVDQTADLEPARLESAFRDEYQPEGFMEGRQRTPVAPPFVMDSLREIARTAVERWIRDHPVKRADFGESGPHVLRGGDFDTAWEIHIPETSGASDHDHVVADIDRPDRAYWLIATARPVGDAGGVPW